MKVYCVYKYDCYEGVNSPVNAVFENEASAIKYAKELQQIHDESDCAYLTYKVQAVEFIGKISG